VAQAIFKPAEPRFVSAFPGGRRYCTSISTTLLPESGKVNQT
jgi:hypothetical protein